MIRANFSRCKTGLHLKLCGHAGYSSGGGDVVCAAVSGIFYALLGYLANCGVGLKVNRLGSGIADVECGLDGEEAMKLCCIGLLQIALTYPGTVSVDSVIWNWRLRSPINLGD